MRFCSLGSGSGGNALIVGSAKAGYVMLDCGFGIKDTETRLASKGLTPNDLRAIIVTHEHGDHIGSAGAFAIRHGLPLVMSHGTAKATVLRTARAKHINLRMVYDGELLLDYADLVITAFSVPHDAAEPLQFTFQSGSRKLGVLTDLGMSTTHVAAALEHCHALVLECNHDEQMLAAGVYPASLKARVGGNYGHLSNRAAAELLGSVTHDQLKHVICAHLSAQNNRPELARQALAQVLGDAQNEVSCATQATGFDWRDA